jgi:hypothetical protein
MRHRVATALASVALALCCAAPAFAGEHGQATCDGGGGGGQAQAAQRLLRAADRFDARAKLMRTRAGRLRDVALEVRQEAEDLAAGDTASDGGAGGDATPPPDGTEPNAPRMDAGTDGGADADQDPTDEGSCGDWEGEDVADVRHDEGAPPPPPPGDDGAGFDDGGASAGADQEVCELLRTATRLERRADALDVAAARMEGHARRLREKAAKLLDHAGETDAQRLLARAARFRARATALRAQADQLRDSAFDGTDVDDDVVSSVERLEVRAASFDLAADRLEARAARMTGASSAS